MDASLHSHVLHTYTGSDRKLAVVVYEQHTLYKKLTQCPLTLCPVDHGFRPLFRQDIFLCSFG